MQASIERSGLRGSQWDNSIGGKRPEEMTDEDKFRMKKATAGALLKDLDKDLQALELNIDRRKGSVKH